MKISISPPFSYSQWSLTLLSLGPVPFLAILPWHLLVFISTSSCCLPTPSYVRGLRTHRELCCQTKSIRSRNGPAQLFPIPSALAGLRLWAGSPYTPPFREPGDKHWPQGPQAAEWVARDQSPLRGATAGD